MPIGLRVVRRIVGEAVHPLSVRVYGVDLLVAVAVALEKHFEQGVELARVLPSALRL